MIDPFIRQLILKYHARGNTELEIAIIAGVDISVVRQCLEEYQASVTAEAQVDSKMAYQGTYELPVYAPSSDIHQIGTSTQDKISYYQALAAGELVFAHQVSLPYPNPATAPSPNKAASKSQAALQRPAHGAQGEHKHPTKEDTQAQHSILPVSKSVKRKDSTANTNSNESAPSAHSSFKPQGQDPESSYSLQSAYQAYTDSYSDYSHEHVQSTAPQVSTAHSTQISIKTKPQPQPLVSPAKLDAHTNKRTRVKSLDKYQDLIMQLLIAHNYNCTKVYQELIAQGIETKLRTVQRYGKQLMSEYRQELKHQVMDPIDQAEHPESMVHYATLMSSHVVTIPAAIRKVMKLKAQDQVMFIYENGKVTLAKARKD